MNVDDFFFGGASVLDFWGPEIPHQQKWGRRYPTRLAAVRFVPQCRYWPSSEPKQGAHEVCGSSLFLATELERSWLEPITCQCVRETVSSHACQLRMLTQETCFPFVFICFSSHGWGWSFSRHCWWSCKLSKMIHQESCKSFLLFYPIISFCKSLGQLVSSKDQDTCLTPGAYAGESWSGSKGYV